MKNMHLWFAVLAGIALFFGGCSKADSSKRNDKKSSSETWQSLGHVSAMPVANESGSVAVKGANIYYAVYGKGAPLVLLHGGLGNTESWANQIPTFSQHYKVIAIASRGHGRSTRDSTQYSIALMSNDVLAVMDHLSIPKAKLVGWSDGANIGINMAMNYSDRVEKVFAFGANYNVAGSRDDYEANPVVGLFIEKAQADYTRLSSTPDKFGDFAEALTTGMWDHEPNFSKEQLGAITIPVAIAFGSHDEFIKLQHAKDMAALIPKSKLILFPSASHFALWQIPEKFNNTALEFLK